MIKIIPGILEKNWNLIEKKILLAKKVSNVIHLDIIDGKFYPNISFLNPKPFEKYSKEVFFEVQFITENPINYVEAFAKVGFKRFIGHIEKMPSQKKFIDFAKKFGEAGLAINLDTPISNIKVDFNYPDCFTIMSVRAGQSGQNFSNKAISKIKKLKEKTIKPIEVDGGINESNIKILDNLKVERCVINSGLFKAKNIVFQYNNLQKIALASNK